MKKIIDISMAKDFSSTPGPRDQTEGSFSGELFLRDILEPAWLKSLEEGGLKIKIDLDGTEGYATSFLEAAFGGLARKYPIKDVLDTLLFKSEEEPYLVDEILSYIKDARNT